MKSKQVLILIGYSINKPLLGRNIYVYYVYYVIDVLMLRY
jgi:hypothetical protein